MKINFIVDMPFRNPDRLVNADFLATHKELSSRLGEKSLSREIEKFTSDAYTQALGETEQLDAAIKQEMKANQERSQATQNDAKGALKLISGLRGSVSGPGSAETAERLRESETLVAKLLHNANQNATKYEEMLIQTNVLNKRLKTMLVNGISEIEGLSAIDRRLNEERELIIADWERKLEELRAQMGAEKRELEAQIAQAQNETGRLEQVILAKDVEAERVAGALRQTEAELRKAQEEQGRLQSKLEDTNRYISELVRAQKEAVEKSQVSQTVPVPSPPENVSEPPKPETVLELEDIKRWIKAVYEGLFTRPEEVLTQSRANFVNDALACPEFSDAEAILNKAVEDAMEKTATSPADMQHPALGMVVFKILSGVVLREFANQMVAQNQTLKAQLEELQAIYA